MMNEEFDIIVVGAGPAGSMAAKTVAQNGIRVLLLEKDPVVGIPLCCAEAISVYGMHQFFRPDPGWISAKINKLTLTSPSGHKVEVDHPDAAYVLDRKLFDKDLAIRAGAEGAEIKVNSCAVSLIKEDGKIKGVKVDENGEQKEYRAQVIVGADGIESMVGRWAGIDTSLQLKQMDSAFQYLVVSEEIDPECMEFYVGEKLAPGGYVWVFPKGQNCANVGLGMSPALAPDLKPKELLDDFVKKRFTRFSVGERVMGGIPTFSRKNPYVKENLLLVGDAGRIIDSLSGAGIANALLSGKMAGQVASEYVRGKNLPVEFLKKYERELLKRRGRELRFYSFCRNVFLKMKDDDFDAVILFLKNYLGGKKIKGIDPFAIVKAIFKSDPRLLRLLKHVVW
jgi:digeranylgeranylglycerophospholipid reductase